MKFSDWVGNIDAGTGVVGVISTVLIPLMVTIAAASFLWGVLNYYFLHPGDETKRAEGRQFVLWGIGGLALIFGIWGILNIALSTLGIHNPGASMQ